MLASKRLHCRGVHAVRSELRGRKFASSAYNRLTEAVIKVQFRYSGSKLTLIALSYSVNKLTIVKACCC